MSTTTTPSLTLAQKPVPHQSDALGSAPSLTIFTIPKSFVGHTGVIQRNAIESWKRLEPACDIVLCGDDPGVADVAAELNVQHLPDLERNELGTPYLDSAFKQVRDASDSDLLCYVNADILLLSDFRAALQHIRAERFLMVGQRCDVDIDEPIDFTEPDWESQVRAFAAEHGTLHSLWGMDYFVFPRVGTLDHLPRFLVGRPGWDNWMIYNARKHAVPVIDATPMALVLHQNHGYRHVPQRSGERWVGPEAEQQVAMIAELMGGCHVRFAIVDATHMLTPRGVVRVRSLRALRRRWETLPALVPSVKPVHTALDPLVRCAVSVRAWMRNRRSNKAAAV